MVVRLTNACANERSIDCAAWSIDRADPSFVHDTYSRPSCSVQLSTQDSCKPPFEIFGREHVFIYFLLHVCLWIILDGARNILIFNRYLRQHYWKIKLQIAVIKLRKEKWSLSTTNINIEWGCIRKYTLTPVSYTHLTLPTNREV